MKKLNHASRYWVLVLMLVATVGCVTTSKRTIEIRVEEPEKFTAPSMLVYVMICDPDKPAPKFEGEDSIEKWIANDSDDLFRALKNMKEPRAERIIVKPGADGTYKVELDTDKELRKVGEIVVVAQFADTRNYTDHSDSVKLADNIKQELYVFRLTADSIEYLPEVKE